MKGYNEVNKCPITGDEEKTIYLDLGEMPLVNNLNSTKEESFNCSKYPLAVQYFHKSKLSTLTVEINPDILYKHYTYKSGISQPYINHCNQMHWFMDFYLNFKEGDKILDIGGNDGTLLSIFKQKTPGLDVLNIDASENIIKESIQKGINSINGFWNKELAAKLNTKFKAIITTNCFQHTAPIESFVEGIAMSLEHRGIWCLEFPYWKNSIDTFQYDQIYHEHLYYYLLSPLKILLDKFGLSIIKITPYKIHGGTLRILISQKGELGKSWQPAFEIDEFLNEETFELEDYIEWGNRIKQHIQNSRNKLLELKSFSKIAGFGAAAKGCIFLNSTGMDDTIIDYVIDDTNLKQNKYIPGTGIPVVSREILNTNPVDYIVILAHNFADFIMPSLRKSGYKGKFVVFFPEFKIYE